MPNGKLSASVLIAGAGPVGLALACDLGLCGIDCVVMEQRDGSVRVPKMSVISARNMEVVRAWKIAKAARDAVWPRTHPLDIIYRAGDPRREHQSRMRAYKK